MGEDSKIFNIYLLPSLYLIYLKHLLMKYTLTIQAT